MVTGSICRFQLAVALLVVTCATGTLHARTYLVGSVLPESVTMVRALAEAGGGDTILVEDGTYPVLVQPLKGGTDANHRLVIKSVSYRGAVFMMQGKVARIEVPWVTLDGLVFDGCYGTVDVVDIRGEDAHHFELKDCEVRNTQRDGIDIEGAGNGRIIRCEIHHCLSASHLVQHDAHGIVAGNMENLLISDCNIYYVSGDAFQADPDRDPWDNVVIENTRMWTGPLPAAAANFPAGFIPGENAVDTKQNASHPRSRIVIRSCQVYGWRGGVIGTMSAFNIKNHVECLIENCVFWDNEICLRLRGGEEKDHGQGGARVTVVNTVFRESDYAIRYEDMIKQLKIFNCTWGHRVDNPFGFRQGLDRETFELRNCLFLLDELPIEARGFKSNLAVGEESFANVKGGDFRLVENSPAIDAGRDLSERGVATDATGKPRPLGAQFDIGAYEY
jgi:hypothetical protein